MAVVFALPVTINADGGNWVSLPALPANMDPMRAVFLSAAAAFNVGTCTAGQATTNSGFFHCPTGKVSLGVVNYNSITVRSVGATTISLFVYHYSPTDDVPEGAG